MTPAARDFLLAYGFRAPVHHLAAVVGESTAAIQELRRRGVCAGGPRRTFGDLFPLFHGRPPRDEDWPAPRRLGSTSYEWLAPELTLLASLTGQIGPDEISRILTARLRTLTGDPHATRNGNAVNVKRQAVGLVSTDVVGGLTVHDAGVRAGSLAIVQQAIHVGRLRTVRVGRLHVIPHAVFETWLAARDQPPEGYVRLTVLRKPLGIKSDSKLPEFAKLGYIPTAVFVRSSHLWFIEPTTAARIIADAPAGRPLPWHGKPMPDNLKATWRKWQQRRHRWCRVCTTAWGPQGAPTTFDDFCRRYPAIDYGLKRHLTIDRATRSFTPRKPWGFHRVFSAKGQTLREAARQLGRPLRWIETQIRLGVVRPMVHPTDVGTPRRLSSRMIDRLRRIPVVERRGRKPGVWLGIYAAARHTGVTICTVRKWADAGQVRHKRGARGLVFGLVTLERRARRYWDTENRFTRATPPAWLTPSEAA